MSVLLRSAVFALFQIFITPPYAVIALLSAIFKPMMRYRIISGWSRITVAAAAAICGIRYRIVGEHNIPTQPCVILAKHQSAWETLAFQSIFPPQVYVIKRELLWIPFFGWGLALMSPIAIDRRAGVRALRQMLRQGAERLASGFWIVVYPEGTRTTPGIRGHYQNGGGAIAAHAHVPVLPVAHNAGTYWPRNAFLKYPGTITVSIGPPLVNDGCSADVLTQQAESWIETEMTRLADVETNAVL